MSYEKQTWATGDTITAEKLNHMEDGIADGGGGSSVFQVIYTIAEDGQGGFTATCNHTMTEIVTAYNAGKYIPIMVDTAQAFANFTFDENYTELQVECLTVTPGSNALDVDIVEILHTFSDNEETFTVSIDSGYVSPFNRH